MDSADKVRTNENYSRENTDTLLSSAVPFLRLYSCLSPILLGLGNTFMPFLARLHEVHRTIVVTSVVRVYVYVYVRVRITLSVKVFRSLYLLNM